MDHPGLLITNHRPQSIQADKQGRISYLESSNTMNLRLYQRLGFEKVRQIYLERGEKQIPMDIMIRRPIVDKLRSQTKGLNGRRHG